MDSIRLRRMAALIGSAALLASMTIATAAAPAAAKGKCLPFENGDPLVAPNCYYAIEPVDISYEVPAGVTLTGTDANDFVNSNLRGTFNGGRGNDDVRIVRPGGTFNGGKGNDEAGDVLGTFNGGPGDDWAGLIKDDGTFNGGPGEDCAVDVGLAPDPGEFFPGSDGTFAGGGGSDTYERFGQGDVWSAKPRGDSCPVPG